MDATRGEGKDMEAATDGSKVEATEEEPAALGSGWCSRERSEEEV
jgi:hypothetical protein